MLIDLTYNEAVWLITAFSSVFEEAKDVDAYQRIMDKLESVKSGEQKTFDIMETFGLN